MNDPDHAKAFPKYPRLYTMSMADKYTAVCYIFEGVHYQNLCKVENPDGTFYYNEKCLAKLPLYSLTQPYIGFDPNTSSLATTNQELVRYGRQAQTSTWSTIFTMPVVVAIFLVIAALIYLLYHYKDVLSSRFRVNQDHAIDIGDGNLKIGKITFNTREVLGLGSRGTFVFKGSFEKKDKQCAVKRIVSQYLTFADREVDLLRDLQHANLVRYFATERCAQYIYIALEMAEYTLSDLIEKNKFSGLSKEEICKQSALGLQYLHNSDIVHRDIKPQNILISFPKKPNFERNVMITDFGLSKDLNLYPTSHSSSYTTGTQGWMAPEILKAKKECEKLAPSKAADIFSLGCLFYYVIFEGKHPFGEINRRDENIEINKSSLNEFKLHRDDSDPEIRLAIMCNNLVQAMINPSADKRPSISSVLRYPLFWSKKKQLQFLSDVSDRLEGDKIGLDRKIEESRQKVIGYGWKESLSDTFRRELESASSKKRSYNEKRLKDLLRLIRNKKNHFKECSDELKSDFGELPNGFMDYFSTRFPELVPHVYKTMQSLKNETTFMEYYGQEDSFIFE